MSTNFENQIKKALDLLKGDDWSPNILFPKERLRVRLFCDKHGELLVPVKSVFKDREKTKFIFPAFNVEDQEPQWKGLVVPKTVARAIMALASEFSLFMKDGHGVMIVKTGEGLKTTYSVTPSRNPVPVPANLLENLPDLEDFAKEYELAVARRAAQSDSEDELSPESLF